MQNKKDKKLKPVNLANKMTNPLYGCKILPHNTDQFLYKIKVTKSRKDEDEETKTKPVTKGLITKSISLNDSKTKLDRLNNLQSTISDLSQKDDVQSVNGLYDNLRTKSLKSLKRTSTNRPAFKTETGEHIDIIEYNINNVINFDDRFDYSIHKNDQNNKHKSFMYKLNDHEQIDDQVKTKYESKFENIHSPHHRKEALKRLHEDYILETKIVNDINGKLRDVKFVEGLKNHGYDND